jgi:hypothetical protein
VQADELEAEVRYRVTFESSFVGTFREVGEYAGIPIVVFDTDPFAGHPQKGSGQRKLPLGGIARVERLP